MITIALSNKINKMEVNDNIGYNVQPIDYWFTWSEQKIESKI